MTIINALASIPDQRTVMHIIRTLEVPPDESVLETELVRKIVNAGIGNPEKCINELLSTKHIVRIETKSGDFIRRTEQ